MQYVGKVGGYVYNQWSSLNPATLSGAIDIIVVEHPDGSMHCSPWHIRFGKFQIIKPSQKKIDLYVNDIKTDLPMKLGDGGEAFFVFETENGDILSQSVLTSPVISPVNSPGGSPMSSPGYTYDLNKSEPDLLDLNAGSNYVEDKIRLSDSTPMTPIRSRTGTPTPTPALQSKIAFEKARKITKKLNIPSKIDINGDMVLDMDGYKPNSQKNIDDSDELFKKIFLEEIKDSTNFTDDVENMELGSWDEYISKDENGNIRILNKNSELNLEDDLENTEGLMDDGVSSINTTLPSINTEDSELTDSKTYFKTLRLTSEQLQQMKLHYGENQLKFKLSEGNSQVIAQLYLWKSTTPIVISDIDGTITKSDALGHVLNLFGKDWTHQGVATLFSDITCNGYNIMYLTARSVGQADNTRQYLAGISQDGGIKLPKGPVILSPDRTMAALRREVILKKPEVFKMACLRDIRSLYFHSDDVNVSDQDSDRTPFYAGFGNRITDAISYRSVKIPSHRIFTINPNGEVHMELLELAGYKSSYLHIGELVDHFFPPIKQVPMEAYWNDDQFNDYINFKQAYDANHQGGDGSPIGSPRAPGSPRSLNEEAFMNFRPADEKFNDVNYWREPINFSDISDDDDTDEQDIPDAPKSPSLMSMKSFTAEPTPELLDATISSRTRSRSASRGVPAERPTSVSSFTLPLQNFMKFGGGGNDTNDEDDDADYADVVLDRRPTVEDTTASDSFASNNEELDDDDDDDEDYTDYEDDYDEDEEEGEEDDDEEENDDEDDDYDEDEEDEEEAEEGDEVEDFDEEEDLDEGDGLPEEIKETSAVPPKELESHENPHIITAKEFNTLNIDDQTY
ncbi:Lipin/Ned1/Smp2-domain-containing protein [Scheffersomyces coipomensis]|uniref:Lipin/Ned1/Smp2-domain-containing protein n=1 Tax=Scheffersomyces coipomensis TaxID=1788519 RepID=UPI00315D3B1A